MSYTYKPHIWNNYNYIKREKMMKQSVRKIIHRAVKAGKVAKLPCEYADCEELKVEAHHPDYSRPLEVLWLCRNHHLLLHRYLSTNL